MISLYGTYLNQLPWQPIWLAMGPCDRISVISYVLRVESLSGAAPYLPNPCLPIEAKNAWNLWSYLTKKRTFQIVFGWEMSIKTQLSTHLQIFLNYFHMDGTHSLTTGSCPGFRNWVPKVGQYKMMQKLGTWVLIWEYSARAYPMNTNMTGFRWFTKIFASLSFWRK